MTRIASLAGFVALSAFAGPALAVEVWVFETSGPGGDRAQNTILESLRAELTDVDVTLHERPRFLKTVSVKLAKKIGKEVAAGDAAFGVASSLVKKKRKISLVIVAVSADGTVVFDKVARLPKKRPDKKIKGLVANVARAIEDEMRRAAPPPEPTPDPAPGGETIAATPVGVETVSTTPTPTPTPIESTPITTPIPPPPAVEEEVTVSRRHRRTRDGFHAAVRGGAGGLFFKDDILTTVQGGELNIKIPMTMLTTAGVQLAYDEWLNFTGSFRYFGANIVHPYEGDDENTAREEPLVEPGEIGCSAFGTTVLLGTGMKMGPLIGGLRLGMSYDSFTADGQTLTTSAVENEVAVLVPSWTRMVLAAGVTLGYGNLVTEGLTGEVGLLVVPWGAHDESPRTSGASSTVLGTQGWLRARYAFPDLFGGGGGVFVDLQADLEFLKIQFKGNGTRTALGGTESVQASKETRIAVGGALSVGYVY